ncbi:MAG TPA: hypothetical protein PKJ45_14290 [Rubrivivax sp.]|nr:hypothetical protein [Rubrivivax sp.]
MLGSAAQAQPDRIFLQPAAPTTYEECRQLSADYYAHLVEIEMARRSCELAEGARPQGVSVSPKGVPTPHCGGRQQAYLSCAPINDKWCAVSTRMHEATSACYKAYHDYMRREQERRGERGEGDASRVNQATTVAKTVRPAVKGTVRLAKLMFAEARPPSSSSGKPVPEDRRRRGATTSDVAAGLTFALVKRSIPELNPVFFDSVGSERLRELALAEAAFANAEFSGFYAKLAPRQLSAQSHALSSLVTLTMAKQYYGISEGALEQLDRAFSLATQPASAPAQAGKPALPPADEEEGGFISR